MEEAQEILNISARSTENLSQVISKVLKLTNRALNCSDIPAHTKRSLIMRVSSLQANFRHSKLEGSLEYFRHLGIEKHSKIEKVIHNGNKNRKKYLRKLKIYNLLTGLTLQKLQPDSDEASFQDKDFNDMDLGMLIRKYKAITPKQKLLRLKPAIIRHDQLVTEISFPRPNLSSKPSDSSYISFSNHLSPRQNNDRNKKKNLKRKVKWFTIATQEEAQPSTFTSNHKKLFQLIY